MPRYVHGVTGLLGKPISFADSASLLFMYDEIFNKQIYKFNLSEGAGYIIDCGANIGLSTIYFKKMYPESRIVAFEPDAVMFEKLQRNLTAFGFVDIIAMQKALWSHEKRAMFCGDGADGGRLARHGDGAGTEISTVRLKEYLNEPVSLLKMDIEGAETEVLQDCADSLNNIERIFIEYHSFDGKAQRLDEILAILRGSGFRYWIHHIGVFSPQPLSQVNVHRNMDLQLNIYASRMESKHL